jgi:plasmid stability protein
MTSITIRNIPNEIFELVKTLAQTEKRSINNELVLLIEKGIVNHVNNNQISDEILISKETQIDLWKEIMGKWEDERATENIIKDIYDSRTLGREIQL